MPLRRPDTAAFPVPRVGRLARHVQAQIQAVVGRHRTELGQVSEVVGGLGAVEQPHPALLSLEQRLSNHRPDLGDSRAARDEQEVALRRLYREHERADRALNSHVHPRRDRVELVPPPPGRLDLDQKIEPAVLEGFDRRGGDGIGNPDFLLREPDARCLTGFEGEPRAPKIEPDDPRRVCRRDHGLNGQNERVGRHVLARECR